MISHHFPNAEVLCAILDVHQEIRSTEYSASSIAGKWTGKATAKTAKCGEFKTRFRTAAVPGDWFKLITDLGQLAREQQEEHVKPEEKTPDSYVGYFASRLPSALTQIAKEPYSLAAMAYHACRTYIITELMKDENKPYQAYLEKKKNEITAEIKKEDDIIDGILKLRYQPIANIRKRNEALFTLVDMGDQDALIRAQSLDLFKQWEFPQAKDIAEKVCLDSTYQAVPKLAPVEIDINTPWCYQEESHKWFFERVIKLRSAASKARGDSCFDAFAKAAIAKIQKPSQPATSPDEIKEGIEVKSSDKPPEQSAASPSAVVPTNSASPLSALARNSAIQNGSAAATAATQGKGKGKGKKKKR